VEVEVKFEEVVDDMRCNDCLLTDFRDETLDDPIPEVCKASFEEEDELR